MLEDIFDYTKTGEAIPALVLHNENKQGLISMNESCPDIILLNGSLSTGKTTLAQAIQNIVHYLIF